MSGGQASYYLGLAREDYYLEGGEPPGQWFGKGAEHLGLVGEVSSNHLYNLFDGLSPDGAKSLVQIQRHPGKADHRPGWDLTFSAPKSVSALWSQASEDHRQLIQEAHLRAVKAALEYLQDTAVLTRRGKDGKSLEESALVAALFEHSTSRALDPQLHTHALLLNVGVREDGTTGTISSLSVFLAKMTAGAIYRVELSGQLEQLGLKTERSGSFFELSGVLKGLTDLFSKRRQAIESVLSQKGQHSAEASAVAAIQTREVKQSVSRAALFEGWLKDGVALGWSNPKADSLFGAFQVKRDKPAEIEKAATLASQILTASNAHFKERDFVRAMAEQSQATGLLAKDVLAGARAYLDKSPDIVRLGTYRGDERFTTKATIELEKSLLSNAGKLADNRAHVVAEAALKRLLKRAGELSSEQQSAVKHLTATTGAIAVVSGLAGTGKTRMLKTAKDAWEVAGFKVFGAAVAAKAADELRKGADIESGTLARQLTLIEKGRSPLDKNSILVLDEAGMVATPDLEKLVRHCHRSRAKLVLVGDARQLQPIGPGAPFKELGAQFGRAELNDVRRQGDAWAREAVKDLARGDTDKAVREFVSRGLVKIHESRDEAMKALVSEWKADGRELKDCLILAGTKKEVRALNVLAQQERLKAGELGPSSVQKGDEQFFVGDRVMFTKNRKGMGVMNGDMGVITRILAGEQFMSVRLDSGERVTFGPNLVRDYTLGYASSTHKSQGATSQNTYVLAGGSMQDRELSYVQASRAQDKTVFFLTRQEAGDEIARLAREMERSRQKDMAHTLIRYKELGLER